MFELSVSWDQRHWLSGFSGSTLLLFSFFSWALTHPCHRQINTWRKLKDSPMVTVKILSAEFRTDVEVLLCKSLQCKKLRIIFWTSWNYRDKARWVYITTSCPPAHKWCSDINLQTAITLVLRSGFSRFWHSNYFQFPCSEYSHLSHRPFSMSLSIFYNYFRKYILWDISEGIVRGKCIFFKSKKIVLLIIVVIIIW